MRRDLGGLVISAFVLGCALPGVLLRPQTLTIASLALAAVALLLGGLLDHPRAKPLAVAGLLAAGGIASQALEHRILLAPLLILLTGALLVVVLPGMSRAVGVIAAVAGCGLVLPFLLGDRLRENPLARRVALSTKRLQPLPSRQVTGDLWSLEFDEQWLFATKAPTTWEQPETGLTFSVASKSVPGLQWLGNEALTEVLSRGVVAKGELRNLAREDLVGAELDFTDGAKIGRVTLLGLGERAWLLRCEVSAARVDALGRCEAPLKSFSARLPLRPVPPDELLASGRAATAFIVTNEATGSGWVVNESQTSRFVVTNAHVVSNAKKVTLLLNDREPTRYDVPVGQVRVSQTEDLAVMLLPGVADSPPSVPTIAVGLQPGTPVWAFGYPYGFALGWGSLPETAVLGGWTVETKEPMGDGGVPSLAVDLGINPGNSGGPVFARDGQFVGIATMKLVNSEVGWVIPARTVFREVERLLPGVRVRSNETSPSPETKFEFPPGPPPVDLSGSSILVKDGSKEVDGFLIGADTTPSSPSRRSRTRNSR